MVFHFNVQIDTCSVNTYICMCFIFQNYVLFNPEDPYQLVTNSETQVIFCSWVSICIL